MPPTQLRKQDKFSGESREKRLVDVQKKIASQVTLQDNFSIDAVAGVDQDFRAVGNICSTSFQKINADS